MSNQQVNAAESSVKDRVVATHMMIRIALTGVSLAIVVSVLVQRGRDDCWLTSISAYWYTDARTIFTGGLIAISICLIAYSGGTWTENLLLNLAGVLAPIVAVAPTQLGNDLDEACLGNRAPGAYDSDATINGLTVYFVVLAVGAIFTIAASRALRQSLLGRRKQSADEVAGKAPLTKAQLRASRFGRVTAALIAAVLILWWALDDEFAQHAHFPSAATMFVFLAFVAASRTEVGSRITSKWDLYRDTTTLPSALAQRRSFPYGFLYGCVAIGMLATLALAGINILVDGWDYGVIAAEFALLGLFLVFWLAQTIQMRDLAQLDDEVLA